MDLKQSGKSALDHKLGMATARVPSKGARYIS